MPILLECILFGRAANFSVGQQTFRSGRKLFGLAANYSARQRTVRSRIKLSGRASNFPVGHQTFRSGFAVCIIYHRLPTFCRFLLSGFLRFPPFTSLSFPPFTKFIVMFIITCCSYIQIEIVCEPRRGPILMLAPLSS